MKSKRPVGSVHWLVHGRVQGVSFRAFARKAALELGLRGWVRNLADGQVEIFAHGDEEALARLSEAASRGPILARVDHLEVLTVPESIANEQTSTTDFEIRPSASAPELIT